MNYTEKRLDMFESFDSFFAGLAMQDETEAMRLYEKYIRAFLAETIEQAENEIIKKVLEVIGKKKRETSEFIRIKPDNLFSIGAMFVLDDLIASLQEEPEPNTE